MSVTLSGKKAPSVAERQTQESNLFDDVAPRDGLVILQSPSLQIANALKKNLTKSSTKADKKGVVSMPAVSGC